MTKDPQDIDLEDDVHMDIEADDNDDEIDALLAEPEDEDFDD